MKTQFINLKRQYQSNKDAIDKAIHSVLDHGQYIMGPEVSELESQLADFAGSKFCLTCSSGTDALVLPLMALELSENDAVFTTPFTFFASSEAISLAGATPVFVDIDPQTYNISPNSLEIAIEKVLKEGKLHPKAILPVDLFGLAADYDKIQSIGEKYDLFVLEDAAQGFGAAYKGRRAGSFGNAAATSFYPAKPLGCYGDGGAVFTDDEDLYNTMISLRVHGQTASGNKYDNIRIGLNARMDSIQAAILLEKLKLYENELSLRQSIAESYTSKLRNHVVTPFVPENQTSVWAQYSIQVENRDKLRSDLQNHGIPTAVFYPIPIHQSTAYAHLNYRTGDFPISEEISKKIVSLPMHPYLEEVEIQEIASLVVESVKS